MKQWFRIANSNGAPAFIPIKREEMRELLARLLKPVELARIPEAEHSEDTRFEAYCRALAEADRYIDAGEIAGQLDVGAFKFRFVAL